MPTLADTGELEEMARRLEASGDYKVLRRVKPREAVKDVPEGTRIGIVLDVETTGLDHAKDEVVELAMVKFGYSETDEVTGVLETFEALNEPSVPLSHEISQITGITPQMLSGRHIDAEDVVRFVRDANVVIAHNAAFDRKFVERFWPEFAETPWACSMCEVPWRRYGFAGANLAYLLAGSGLFHGAHRALDDCGAVLELLARPLPGTCTTGLSSLLSRARRRTVRIWAEDSPFDLKHVLKARGYRWQDGGDGSPRCWYVDVEEQQRDAELDFLTREIYQREVQIRSRSFTALERYSDRV